MNSNTPEQFAKQMLWQISQLHAEVIGARADIDKLVEHLRPEHSTDEAQQHLAKQTQMIALQQYEKACRSLGFSTQPPHATAPQDTEGDSR